MGQRGVGSSGWIRGILRWVMVVLGSIALFFALALVFLVVPTIPDPVPGLLKRKGSLAGAQVTDTWIQEGAVFREATLKSTSGLEVDLTVRAPIGTTVPRPLVLLLAGYGTGRDAVRYSADTRGVVVASLSYPYRGDTDAGLPMLLLELPNLQQALLDTIPAVLLATDWLVEQAYVDPERVELAGGSMGAFLVGPAGALDPRFRRVWLVHGGGEPAAALELGLAAHIDYPPARRWAARLVSALASGHHLAPEKWVGRISPRPVIVVSALDDESIPRESVAALHEALVVPSEVIWMRGGHVLPDRDEIIRQVTDVVFSRVLEDTVLEDTVLEGQKPSRE